MLSYSIALHIVAIRRTTRALRHSAVRIALCVCVCVAAFGRSRCVVCMRLCPTDDACFAAFGRLYCVVCTCICILDNSPHAGPILGQSRAHHGTVTTLNTVTVLYVHGCCVMMLLYNTWMFVVCNTSHITTFGIFPMPIFNTSHAWEFGIPCF